MHVAIHVSVRRRLLSVAASVALGALALGAASVASAEASVLAPGACDDSPLSQPFSSFGDPGLYKLVPGGDFEATTAWSLSGGAGVVAGSDTSGVGGPRVGASSLSLPSGAVAVSPATCVNAAYPTFRLAARSASPGSVVSVAVVYQTPRGPITLPVGSVVPGHDWAPTASMQTLAAIGTQLSGGSASVALRFTQVAGSSQIDDVYVDPHTVH